MEQILNSDWFISLMKLVFKGQILEPEVISDLDYLINFIFQTKFGIENQNQNFKNICSAKNLKNSANSTNLKKVTENDTLRQNRALIAIRSGAFFSTPDSILEVLQVPRAERPFFLNRPQR